MSTKNQKIYDKILQSDKNFYLTVIIVEVITYTFSFIVSGLIKKDIFNVLEGTAVSLGIHSLKILISINVSVPLVINGVKQINSGLVAKVESRLIENARLYLIENVLGERLGLERVKGYGETISFFRNESRDLVNYLLEYYYQMPKIVLCIAILIVMVCMNPMFALISLIPTFSMIFFIKYLGKHIVENREAARKATGAVTEYLSNLFGNIEYFKLAANEERLCQVFLEKCEERSRCERKDRVMDRMLSIISENSANFVLGIVLLIAIPFYRAGMLSVGEFVMFEYYYAFLSVLPDSVGKLFRSCRQAEVSAVRLQPVIKQDYEGKAVYNQNKLKICLKNGEKEITVEAQKGEVIPIRGKNERERSIILQRMYQTCIKNLPKMKCQYIPQQPILFHDTILYNICMGESYDVKKMKEILRKTDLNTDLKEFEDGIYKNVGKQGTAISGGQRKRIAIARALYVGADLLFIDELSEAVDPRTKKVLVSNILNQKEYIVFITGQTTSMIGEEQ